MKNVLADIADKLDLPYYLVLVHIYLEQTNVFLYPLFLHHVDILMHL